MKIRANPLNTPLSSVNYGQVFRDVSGGWHLRIAHQPYLMGDAHRERLMSVDLESGGLCHWLDAEMVTLEPDAVLVVRRDAE